MSISLPAVTTVEGIVARMLIAESSTPDFAQYDEAQSRLSMVAMKSVVNNRLCNQPAQFGAPGAVNYIDIITAHGQFYGFSMDAAGNVVISSNVQSRIDMVLSTADTDTTGKFSQFVENAIEVANRCSSDPIAGLTLINGTQVTGGSYGWRAARSSDPGGRFMPIPATHGGIIQGNKFYTLKK